MSQEEGMRWHNLYGTDVGVVSADGYSTMPWCWEMLQKQAQHWDYHFEPDRIPWVFDQ